MKLRKKCGGLTGPGAQQKTNAENNLPFGVGFPRFDPFNGWGPRPPHAKISLLRFAGNRSPHSCLGRFNRRNLQDRDVARFPAVWEAPRLFVEQNEDRQPKLTERERKGGFVGVRFKSSDRRLLEKAASIDEKDLPKWMRSVLIASATRQIQRATGASA